MQEAGAYRYLRYRPEQQQEREREMAWLDDKTRAVECLMRFHLGVLLVPVIDALEIKGINLTTSIQSSNIILATSVG